MNDGGPAFPRPTSTDEHDHECMVDYGHEGMTLRDYFAASALTGMCAKRETLEEFYPTPLAIDAYRLADAMLKAREENTDD